MQSVKAAPVLAILMCGLLAACPEAASPPSDPPSAEAPAGPASSASVPAYVGTWAADAAGCGVPQEQMGAPHVFAADRYDQHEAHCTFTSANQTAPNAWRIEGACSVEGDEQQATWDLVVDGDSMTMAPNPQRLVRCPQ
jgi:hypothetical protein